MAVRRRLFLAAWVCLVGAGLSGGRAVQGRGAEPKAATRSTQASRPNFVVVLADDLGYGDLGCYGSREVLTPHLDRFARQGVRFTRCYAAAANCSPSRAGLLTGRTPYRLGIYTWIPFGSPVHLRRSEVTVATLLKRAGYQTCLVGKWHLNGGLERTDQPQPSDHGFDYWFATQNNALPCHRNPDNFVRNGKPVGPLRGFSAQLVVDEAERWLRQVRRPERPFFLLVCFHEPHEPIATDHRFTQLYPDRGGPSPFDPQVSRYAAHHGNVTQMDDAFGRLMRLLDELGLSDTTFVFFTSDNGPAVTRWHPYGSAGPLRGKKGQLYEGGIRVPGLLRWPGHVRPGRVVDEPVCGVDLLPTICEAASVPLPADRTLDGTSFLPALQGRPLARPTPLYWQFAYATDGPQVAMRVGRWKVTARLDTEPFSRRPDLVPGELARLKSARLTDFRLFDLKADPQELKDLASQLPERLHELAEKLKAKHRDVQQDSPLWPAWTWTGYEGKRIRALIESLRATGRPGPRR